MIWAETATTLPDECRPVIDMKENPNRFAKYKCNKCGKIVLRDLGWKQWTTSFCESSGEKARLYRISAPVFNEGGK